MKNSTHDGRSDDQQALWASRWIRARSAAQLFAPSTWPSGRIYSTPVDVLDRDGKRYLVAPRGYTQWVRNAIASGAVSLKKGRRSEEFGIRLLSDDEGYKRSIRF